jgi:3-hydroxy-9,10-secoandrosta-1,3,5(10)-triene-9,17-dione monooxygenase
MDTPVTTRVAREEWIERARDMVPRLKARAAGVEKNRRMDEATHTEFLANGLYKVMGPSRFGWPESEYALLVDISAELGRGCGSTAWVWAQLAGHDPIVGMFPPKGQDEMWGEDPAAVASSAFPNPGSSTKKVPGGIVLNGSWGFSSGCDFATWNMFLCFIPREGGGVPVNMFAIAPRKDYEIEDDWFPVGLAGTGSKKVHVKELFIPDHRVLNIEEVRGGPSPGSAANPGALYKVAALAAGTKIFAGPAIGCARGALEAVEDEFRGRVGVGGTKLAEQQSVQMRLAEADAGIDAAWALMIRDCEAAMAWGRKGVAPPLADRVRWRRNDAVAIKMCIDAVERLFPLTGGRGLTAGSAFQRAWRDCHACGQQIMSNWDVMMTHFGRMRMGLPVEDPRI